MKDIDPHIKLKTILSLKKLLLINRSSKSDDEAMADSYEKIGRNTQLRKATITAIFTGRSNPRAETLILVIKGMGFTLIDFAKIYETITDKEIGIYKNSIVEENSNK